MLFSYNKLITILGPTATGKSDLAVLLAQKFNGEVISADSRQVYRGMDLGTGKITRAEMQNVPHYLLDVANPSEQFSVAKYQILATKALAQIQTRFKLPILCGGTGQYIKAITQGDKLPSVPPNAKLRRELETWETVDLAAELKHLDPTRHESIDRYNRRRLIRAIEIAKSLGSVPKIKSGGCPNFEVLTIGLSCHADKLREKIHSRLLARLQIGMLEEVKRLYEGGLSWQRLYDFGLEYRYCAKHLRKEMSREQMIQKLETEIWRYAKRQMTWFKKFNADTHWFSPNERQKIVELASNFIQK